MTVERDRDLGHFLAEHLRERLGSLVVLVDRIGIRALAVVATHIGAILIQHHEGVWSFTGSSRSKS